MQLLLPIFPVQTTLTTPCLGVYELDGIIQYLVNGLPVYSHGNKDNDAFRFITSNFIHQGLCRKVDFERAFGVSEDSVSRVYKKFLAKGEAGFFGSDARHGKAHKIVGGRRERIQSKLDKGQSIYSIAKQEGVMESAIRYDIKQGFLKNGIPVTPSTARSTQSERNRQDQESVFGMATTRLEDRISSSLVGGTSADVQFEDSQALSGAGVLFLMPALLAQGLLKTKDVYTWGKHFYRTC